MCQPDYPVVGPQLQLVPDQLHHLQGLLAAGRQLQAEHAGPVHLLQVLGGSVHVRGVQAGYHHQGFYAGLDKMVTSLSREMLQTLLRFSRSTSFHQPSNDLFVKFSTWGPLNGLTLLLFTLSSTPYIDHCALLGGP